MQIFIWNTALNLKSGVRARNPLPLGGPDSGRRPRAGSARWWGLKTIRGLRAPVSGLRACLSFTTSHGTSDECMITDLEHSRAGMDACCKCARHTAVTATAAAVTAAAVTAAAVTAAAVTAVAVTAAAVTAVSALASVPRRAPRCAPHVAASVGKLVDGAVGAISVKGPQGTRSTYRSGNRVRVRLGLGLSANEHRQTHERDQQQTVEIESPCLKAHPSPAAVGFGMAPLS